MTDQLNIHIKWIRRVGITSSIAETQLASQPVSQTVQGRLNICALMAGERPLKIDQSSVT